MKNYALPLLLIVIILVTSCKPDIRPDTPGCIHDKIKEFSRQGLCDSGKNVREYRFQGIAVFVFNPGNCAADLTAGVYNAACNYLASLGGIAGNTMVNGEDFSNAIFIRIIWKN